jgi:nitroreductase
LNKEKIYSADPVTEAIRKRFSCRSYLKTPLAKEKREHLKDVLAYLPNGPFGSSPRFELLAASEEDNRALRGLGTYGFIQNAPGFIVGAINPCEKDLEDFGYLMEVIILYATSIGMGTCWLGGSFTSSSFAKRIALAEGEQIPAVTAIGYMDDPAAAREGFIRRYVRAHQRRPWTSMFWNRKFGEPLSEEQAGQYAEPLEMLRLGPSASNRQPWQVVKEDDRFHFFLRRTEGYRKGLLARVWQQLDLQRVDMGIAMSHFELTAQQLGLKGRWVDGDPGFEKPLELENLIEYIVSWMAH